MDNFADPLITLRTIPKSVASHRLKANACMVFIYPTGPNMGTRYELSVDFPAHIGRTDDCQLFNTDSSVSRLHARIEAKHNGYYVVDLDSTNGTYVNNVRVKESRLNDGDSVRIGNCLYRFLEGGNLERVYHEEIYRLTVIDSLTKLHNRRYLMDTLDREFSRAQRYTRPLSVVMLDIDHFKRINDIEGHLAGDFVLCDLAALIQQAIRKDELFARYGGEEFCIVLPETTLPEAILAAERYRELVERHPFSYQDHPLHVTVSLGAACHVPTHQSAIELIESADERLYAAKAHGRNCVCS